ncbi:MAG: hypothetical protein M3544_03690, partial [Pseudomonadota bacterium]|nr:hypothetical protein [Pseudomonadota bacterium]
MAAKKRILGWVLVAGVAVAAAASLLPTQTSPDAAPVAKPQGQEARPAEPLVAVLPSREGIGQPRGEFFGSRSWTPPQAPARPQAAPVAAPPVVAPTAPPMPYRVAGQVVREGQAQVVLARDDRVLTVREGDTLDGGYRVELIKPDGVTLVYTPLGVEQHLPVASALALDAPRGNPSVAQTLPPQQAAAGGGPRPAQLRWEGPARVQAGSPFDVALKLTSDQPVRSSPL